MRHAQHLRHHHLDFGRVLRRDVDSVTSSSSPGMAQRDLRLEIEVLLPADA